MSTSEPLYGLVLAGGKSERMGHDKALLSYHGQPQYEYLSGLLSECCDEVYISCHAGQEFYTVPVITDDPAYIGTGPVAGLMTAMEKLDSALIVIAVDYPLINRNDIMNLIYHRDRRAVATVYYNTATGFYEPFLGIYEVPFKDLLKQEISIGHYSVQDILRTHHTKQVTPANLEILRSIDTSEAYQAFIKDHENT